MPLLLVIMADERLGLRERIGGVKERVLRLLEVITVGPADIGWCAELLLLLVDPRAVVRIWMLKGRFVGLGCWFCW